MANRINTKIGEYKRYNAQPVLLEVEKKITRLEKVAKEYKERWGWRAPKYISTFEIKGVCNELSIFDWWNDRLSLSQLKQMRTFLKEAIKLGYTGYVCFKVGATYCSNGMWAYREPTTNGYSPDGEFLYRSFTPDYTYWDICYNRECGDRADKLSKRVGKRFDELTTIKALEEARKEIA